MPLIGRSVYLYFPFVLGMLACSSEPAGSNDDTATGGATEGSTEGSTGDEPAPRLAGVADLHLHMFAEEAFGGGWFHGSHAGDGPVALAPCDGGSPGDHARLRDELAPLLGGCDEPSLDELGQRVPLVGVIAQGGGALISELIAATSGSEGDTGKHSDRTSGWPDFTSWPRWDAIAHQQVWHEQLYTAYEAGLRVAVISAVSFDWLCRALPDENLTRPQCDEMADVKVQLTQANAFAQAHDWVEVALGPEDLRRIVGEDKLAFVLSIEASHIMGDGDWSAQLDELYDLGVRTLQPVHQLDNRFGGAAPHNPIFHVAQYAENCHIDEECGITTNDLTLGFDVDASCRNTRGLTEEGRALVQAMIDRAMLIDAAHLSEQSVRDLYEIAVASDYYPIYISHGHLREIMLADKEREEKTTPAWVIEILRETGGMFGIRTAHEEVDTYEPSNVENSCHGSSRSFAQAYDYARLGLGVAVGLGSDLNGFIQQTRPRFGPDACSASFPTEGQCQARDERNGAVGRRATGLDEMGLGHAGLLIDLLDDLDALGTDTEPLRTSAEDFARMWERASAPRSGPIVASTPPDTTGIVELPPHIERKNDYPTECGVTYCPGAIVSGERCRFDAECESGTCEGAGSCGMPAGTCA